MSNPMDQIKRLGEALNEQTVPIGLKVVNFQISPATDERPFTVAQAVFEIDESAFKTDEQLEGERVDAELRKMEANLAIQDRQEKASAVKEKTKAMLKRMAEDPDYLGDDDEDAEDDSSTS